MTFCDTTAGIGPGLQRHGTGAGTTDVEVEIVIQILLSKESWFCSTHPKLHHQICYISQNERERHTQMANFQKLLSELVVDIDWVTCSKGVIHK